MPGAITFDGHMPMRNGIQKLVGLAVATLISANLAYGNHCRRTVDHMDEIGRFQRSYNTRSMMSDISLDLENPAEAKTRDRDGVLRTNRQPSVLLKALRCEGAK